MDSKPGVDFIGNCVVFLCHDGEGNFAMQKRSENARDERGKWDLGGGRVETCATVEETIRTEILEEYGMEAKEIEFLGYRDVHRVDHEGRKTHWIALDFKVLVDLSTMRNGEPHKFDEVRVFRKETLPPDSELHSTVPVIFKNYEGRI